MIVLNVVCIVSAKNLISFIVRPASAYWKRVYKKNFEKLQKIGMHLGHLTGSGVC